MLKLPIALHLPVRRTHPRSQLRWRIHVLLWLPLALSTGFGVMITLVRGLGTLVNEGHQIAYQSNRTGNWEIHLLDVTRGTTVQLTDHPAMDGAPAWSPDGERLAFVSNRSGAGDIYILSLETMRLWRVTHDIARDLAPRWLDDERIGFISERDGEAPHTLYITDMTGEQVQRIERESSDGRIWSPDGTQAMLVLSDLGSPDIFRITHDDPTPRPFIRHTASDGYPVWSPDARHIAFASARGGSWGLYRINADGSALMRLTDHPLDEIAPTWRPH